MDTKDYIIKSFCISLIAHTFFVYGVPGLNVPSLKRHKQPEVTYYRLQEKENSPDQIKLTTKQEQQEQVKPETRQAQKQTEPQETINKDIFKNILPKRAQESPRSVKAEAKLVKIQEKRSITTSPAFLTYNNFIREKIRKKAVYIYNKPYEQGNVYVSFTVEKTGVLKAISVVAEKSCGNEYLKQIAKKSILDSSPFPVFPEDLDIPEVTFSVLMSFRAGTVSN